MSWRTKKGLEGYETSQDDIMHFLPGVRLNESFGDKGILITKFATPPMVGAVAEQRDAKILVAGLYGVFTVQFQVARYNTDGCKF